MRNALVIADEVGAVPRDQESSAAGASIASIEPTMAQLESSAKTLRELQKAHRNAILSSVAGGAVSADDAIARVETIRRLEAIARHAWRCAAHLAQ
jgi:phosphate:Na+ symporter